MSVVPPAMFCCCESNGVRREKEAKAKLLFKVELVCNSASIVILAHYSTDVRRTCNECNVFQKQDFTDNVLITVRYFF